MRPTFIEAKQLREITGLPTLGAVSIVISDRQAKKNSKQFMMYVLSNIILLLGYSVVMFSDKFF